MKYLIFKWLLNWKYYEYEVKWSKNILTVYLFKIFHDIYAK